MSHRREFLTSALATGLTLSTGSPLSLIGAPVPAPKQDHKLPPLPYDYNALEPYIDEQTMRLHHDKHHQGYVNGLNKAEEMLTQARSSGDYSLVQHWSRQAAFHGGGHWLHSMFWKVMAPNGKGGGGEPSGVVMDAIKSDFGSFDAFKKQFTSAANAVEGSGWALLLYRMEDKKLIVLQAENQQKLSVWGAVPVLGIDVWEHAYYLKYQNRRLDYIESWWNVVNWKQIELNLNALI